MLKKISLCFISILFSCVITGVSNATLIGVETHGFCMPDTYVTSNSGYLETFSERPWGVARATASTAGHLTTRSDMLSLADGSVYSRSWLNLDIVNTSTFQNQYYLDLNYIFNLNPGYSLDHLEGGNSTGVVNVMVNNVQVANYGYYNQATVIDSALFNTPYVEFSGPDQVVASHNIFLGVLAPGESFSLDYSVYTMAYAYEYYSSMAGGELYASVSEKPIPTPEPSSFSLLFAGLAGIGMLIKRMKNKNCSDVVPNEI